MAFAFKGSGGTAQSSALNQTTATLTTTLAGAVGDLAILLYAVDNNAITDGDENAVLSVTCGTGNVWIKAKEFTNGQAAIQAGATCGMWFCNLFKPQPVGTVITVSFGDPPARDASAFTLGYFTEAVNFTGVVAATGALANDSQTAGSLDATTSNIACLRIRATASESNSTVAWTKTAAFDGLFAQAVTNSGGGAVNQGIRAEYDISTGTTMPSLPTGGAGGATDHASIYVAFREVPTQFLTPPLTDDGYTIFYPISTLYFWPQLATDADAVSAAGISTSNAMSGIIAYADVDKFTTPDVLRGDNAIAAASVMDNDDILDVVVIPNARYEIGLVEDDDIIHRPEISTLWVVFDAYIDSDDFTADTTVTSINYIPHSVISFDTVIEPTVVSQTQAISSGMGNDDLIFGSGSQSTSDADPGYHGADDLFFASTFALDIFLTAALVVVDDASYSAVVTDLGPNFVLIPARHQDADTIRSTIVTYLAPPVLRPVLLVDADTIRTPAILRRAMPLAPSRPVDVDAIHPPFIGRRRTSVRSGAGVIKGTIDTVSLIGDRDKVAA